MLLLFPVVVLKSIDLTLPTTVPSVALISVFTAKPAPSSAKLVSSIFVIEPALSVDVLIVVSNPHPVGAVLSAFIST